jgi:hypothetical protein
MRLKDWILGIVIGLLMRKNPPATTKNLNDQSQEVLLQFQMMAEELAELNSNIDREQASNESQISNLLALNNQLEGSKKRNARVIERVNEFVA